jgi:hypothetical protein
MTVTAYVAGPMRGYPLYNFPAFFSTAASLRADGWNVLNPAEHDMANGFDPSKTLDEQTNGFSLFQAFDWDLKAVAEADAIVLLPGWENSQGATTELAVALSLGKSVFKWDPNKPIGRRLSPLMFDRFEICFFKKNQEEVA